MMLLQGLLVIGVRFYVLYVNYYLCGEESDVDVVFVCQVCEENGFVFQVDDVDGQVFKLSGYNL